MAKRNRFYSSYTTITDLGCTCRHKYMLGIATDNSNRRDGVWKECEMGKFICGVRVKLYYKREVTGVEFKCCPQATPRGQISRSYLPPFGLI